MPSNNITNNGTIYITGSASRPRPSKVVKAKASKAYKAKKLAQLGQRKAAFEDTESRKKEIARLKAVYQQVEEEQKKRKRKIEELKGLNKASGKKPETGLQNQIPYFRFGFCLAPALARPVVRALCTTPKQDLHLYAVLRTSSHVAKQSKSSFGSSSTRPDYISYFSMSASTKPVDDAYGYDLGSFHRRVNTSNSTAQTWFDRGLTWSFAFNHEEAIRCFETALTFDPDCAMAYWGLAYAMGPNYNKAWDSFDENDLSVTLTGARDAIAKAKAVIMHGDGDGNGDDDKIAERGADRIIEAKLIDTLQFRYPATGAGKDFSTWNREYASAMGQIYEEFPDDFDVVTLYVEALMNLTPWQLWDLRTGQPAPGARTMDAKRVLDRALAQGGAYKHPGLLHMYIHLMEMSGTPESALPVANHLRGLIPDAGHLNHMPTHIDILRGDYQRAIVSNSDAVVADEKFLAREGPINFYSLYRAHDYHFVIYAAMFAGQSKIALETTERAEASLPEEVLRVKSPPMADWLEGFLSVRLHVLIRFGRWREIIDLHLPLDQELYCTTTAMMHYAKGVAFAASGEIGKADEQRAHFHDAVKRVPSTRILFNNSCLDVLAIAGAMLEGELEYRRGNYGVAFEHLRKSISLDDNLPYDEPWGWMQPTRHAYGALLLEQGHVEEAAAVYKADLGLDNTLPRALQHPNNVWALHGYHECLVRLGRTGDEVSVIHERLQRAAEGADVPIIASCFCRLGAVGEATVEECCGK